MNRRRFVPPLLLALSVALGACSSLDSAQSPDIVYGSGATQARALQVPPDLTDISDAEQFIVPGDRAGAITRNTLLPSVDGVRFVRSDAGSWLEFDTTPEDLWPRVIEFIASTGRTVSETLPVAGTVSTRWSSAESTGVLRNLIAGDMSERIAFRLERAASGSRLFARRQVVATDDVDTAPAWPTESSDPEATSELLARLLVFLGVDEQKSRGIISAADAADVLNPAVLRTTSAGSQLVLHRGYRSAFEDMASALLRGGHTISGRDDTVGRIAFSSQGAQTGDAEGDGGLILSVVPVHVSAVRVSVTDDDGRRLPTADEQKLLAALVEDIV
jgi:outer membrane protein assembly factor BamC